MKKITYDEMVHMVLYKLIDYDVFDSVDDARRVIHGVTKFMTVYDDFTMDEINTVIGECIDISKNGIFL